ncbi:GNAT family N-acetyltransferase [Streptomyces sp. NPDC087270]|uniref:GNAT family N-acetyltransferase n=1 Tax=Streptomyces sp. NPDC087270 TaxID=3365774 RepID=UPI00381D4490
MTAEIRTLEESDVADWVRAQYAGFHLGPSVDAEVVATRRSLIDLSRSRGAFDRGRCVATFRSMPRELTVPGGAAVPASAVTNVSVTATHRRRGLAGRMMAADIADAKERGDAVSILIAAEYPIYGRFGFGPATWVTNWEVDVARAALDHRYAGPDDGGRVDMATLAELGEAGPALHDRVRAATPGAIDRPPLWWRRTTGEVRLPEWKERYCALYRGPDGEVDGFVLWDVQDHHWPGKLPRAELTVGDLIAATPAAEQALWRFLFSMDWITRITSGYRAPDDIMPLLLGDPRAARPEAYADFMWLRVLDTPAALTARRYEGAATGLVLQVHDEVRDGDRTVAGPAAGRFLLETDDKGAASCTPSTAPADLSLSAADLGCLYLGDESAVRLAVLGRITEHRAQAARVADTLFRTARRPWCPDVF